MKSTNIFFSLTLKVEAYCLGFKGLGFAESPRTIFLG